MMTSTRLKRLLITLPILLIAAGWLDSHNPTISHLTVAAEAKSRLVDLDGFDLLKKTFEQDSGRVRLITLLSPT